MGNKCLSPCPSTPLTDVKSKFRCSYFCCLKGATINVIHTGNANGTDSETDTVDGIKTEDILLEEHNTKSAENTHKNGV
jgi:hypothetical protein